MVWLYTQIKVFAFSFGVFVLFGKLADLFNWLIICFLKYSVVSNRGFAFDGWNALVVFF